MIRLGIAAGTGGYHGRYFVALINGWDPKSWPTERWPHEIRGRVEGAEVVAVWDEDREAARLLAEIAHIPHVCAKPEEMMGEVDGVLICEDRVRQHQRQAPPFLRAKMPTFIDKVLSTEPDEAAELVALARECGAPLLSSSSLRFARELREAEPQLEAAQPLLTATAIGPADLRYYGIHPISVLQQVMGAGIEWVQNLGREGEEVIVLAWRDGRRGVLQVYEKIRYTFEFRFHGENGHVFFPVADEIYYKNMLDAFVEMVSTGKPPYPPEDEVEVIRVLAAARQSRDEGGRRIPLGTAD